MFAGGPRKIEMAMPIAPEHRWKAKLGMEMLRRHASLQGFSYEENDRTGEASVRLVYPVTQESGPARWDQFGRVMEQIEEAVVITAEQGIGSPEAVEIFASDLVRRRGREVVFGEGNS